MPNRKTSTKVKFLPGDGTTIMVEVAWISDFPKDKDGLCAFCHGDPCAESTGPESEIARFYQRNKRADTCPMCLGRPS